MYAPNPPKLLDRLRMACRVRHYSPRTADAYRHWCRRFILFHRLRHPQEMAEPEVNAFLTHLAVRGHVAASTQNQAMAALLFLYRHVLGRPLDQLSVVRANRPKRLPVVLTRDEVRRVLAELTGTYRLVGELLYGSGLRLLECLQLRVKDRDFATGQVIVRDAKGGTDRRTVLPEATRPGLEAQLVRVRALHAADVADGWGWVWLRAACETAGLTHIAVDGKAVRSAPGNTFSGCLHLVSAWAAENRLILGQAAVVDGSHEIAAIPELLKVLELKGALVTIDAAGCQKEIARQVRVGGGDYLLAVKGRRPPSLTVSPRGTANDRSASESSSRVPLAEVADVRV